VLDSNLRTPPTSNIFNKNNNDKKIFIIYSDEINCDEIEVKKRINDLKNVGAILLESPTKNKKIFLNDILSRLGNEFNITSLLVEGGSEIFSSFINSNLVNELHFFIAPMIMGNGKKAFNNTATNTMNEIKKFRIAACLQSGTDEQMILLNP
jgi:diaminohydroxyphosphoribosylaminopyrimidine deaminase/5-amino-6-(5-phosphoribosylamino)uracil reductase